MNDSQSHCDVLQKVDFIDNQWSPTQWLDWEEVPKHFLKPNLHQKRSWSLFGGLLPVWSTTAFWILEKPLHLRSMLSNSVRCPQNCDACSWHWSTEKTQFFSTVPDHTSHTYASKVEWIGSRSFASSAILTWPLPNWLSLLQASRQFFAGKMPPQPAGGRRCFPRVHWIPKHGYLHYRNKQTYFSLAKNGAYFD